MLNNFDEDTSVKATSGKHTVPSHVKDMEKVVRILKQEKIFQYTQGRCFPTFNDITLNPAASLNFESLVSWMYMHLNYIIHGF